MSRGFWRRRLFVAVGLAAVMVAARVAYPLADSYAGSPYGGSPPSIPGTIQAADYDYGGEGVAYGDGSPGNYGGAYRSGDVDIEPSAEGGFDVGWTEDGEWLNYTVNVQSSDSYTAQIRVASPYGGALHIGFNGPSSVWTEVSVPNTGGWQNWTTVNVPVSLGAGVQQMTLLIDAGGFNFSYINVVASGTPPPPPPPPGGGGGGTQLNVATWNIEILNNSEAHARVAMDMMMAFGPQPDVVVIQEAYLDWFNTYLDELQQQTGRTWYGRWASHCQAGNWNGSSCDSQWYQGVAIFSTYEIVGSSSTFFPYSDCWTSARAGLRAALDVNGTTVQVFTTHLQTGGCSDDATARYNSMGRLKSWAANFSTPQLVAGDFNADADQIVTTAGMLPNFADAWPAAGSGWGFTAFEPDPNMRIDYWFSDVGGRAQPVSANVVNWTGDFSDHYPVQASFVIR
jgi:endonuclease/exonuclease/phosphatase family metal-dependent hydrolase